MKQGIQKALQEMGINSLTSMQTDTIDAFENGKNVLLEAPTGSGKTFAYLIPLLDITDPISADTEGLIITPTRELALQVSSEAEKLSAYTGHHNIALIGGMDIHHQENALKHRPTILIGTPGRISDLIDQGLIQLNTVKAIILDEADQILTTGQKDTVLKILSFVPSSAQQMLVSATWKDQLNIFLKGEYTKISTGIENTLNDHISVFYDICSDKRKTLMDILHHEDILQAIIFVHFKSEADELSSYLQKEHILSHPFSSHYDERTRRHTLDSFRKGNTRILVATDAASRGLDITDISHIIHYDLPDDPASFIHRSGRSAHQAAQLGKTIALLLPEENVSYIKEIGSPYSLPNNKGNDLSKPFIKAEEKKPDTLTLWINAGRKDKIRPKDIIGALCTITDFKNLGALEIQDTSSTITIQNTDSNFLSKLSELPIKGKQRKYKVFH